MYNQFPYSSFNNPYNYVGIPNNANNLLGLTKTERNIILGILHGITNKIGNHDKD